MKIYFYILNIIVLLSLSGCSSTPNVHTDSDPNQDFSIYKTFSWTALDPSVVSGDYVVSPFIKKEVMDSIQKTLENKGYEFTSDLNNADFAVSFTIGARDIIDTQREPAIMYSDWRWGMNYFGPQVSVLRNVQYTQGVLAIDVFDVKRRSPVWHGVGKKRLIERQLTENLSSVQPAVDRILQSFVSR